MVEQDKNKYDRREFLKRLGILTAGGILASTALGENPPLLNAAKVATVNLAPGGINPSENARSIVNKLHQKSDGSTPWRMILENIYPVNDTVHFLAHDKNYPDTWVRDYYFASTFFESPALDDNVCTQLGKKQNYKGQIPTTISIPYFGDAPYQYSDDESHNYYLLMIHRLAKTTPELSAKPR